MPDQIIPVKWRDHLCKIDLCQCLWMQFMFRKNIADC